jgi:hypothetical protein
MKSFDLLKMDSIHESKVWIKKIRLLNKTPRLNKKFSKRLRLRLFDSKILALLRIKLKLSFKRQKSLLAKSSFRFFFKKIRLSTS